MVSKASLKTLKNLYTTLNCETSPFSELEFSKPALKRIAELVKAGLVDYKSGGNMFITPDGEKVLEKYPGLGS